LDGNQFNCRNGARALLVGMCRWQSTSNPFSNQPNHQLHQNLPELALTEGNQRVAMKPDESLSPSLFTFRSHFAAIHHH
jgi:hypothetical protein